MISTPVTGRPLSWGSTFDTPFVTNTGDHEQELEGEEAHPTFPPRHPLV